MPHTDLTPADVDIVHTAATVLSSMASARRLALLAEVAGRNESQLGTSFSALAESLGWSLKEVGKESVRLIEAGLLRLQDGELISDLGALRGRVADLDSLLPLADALAENPTAARFFSHGKLTVLPEDQTKKVEVCRVIVQLLPWEVVLDEAQVNALLAPVYADVAGLRRLLFDTGMVDREASTGYRRLA